ncbi:MAG: hypothetical protein ACKOOD_04450 [Microbacteriaceae bacterium]
MINPTNTNDLFKLVLKQGTLLAAAIAALGAGMGFLIAGENGTNSALIGALVAFVFNGFTAFTVWLGGKLPLGGFFGLVLGGWLVKIILFMVAMMWLKTLDWIHGPTLFFAIVASILGGLTIDALAVNRARLTFGS